MRQYCRGRMQGKPSQYWAQPEDTGAVVEYGTDEP